MSHRRSVILLIVAALLWSSGGLLIKWVSAHPLAIACWRSVIGFFVILAWSQRIDLKPSLSTILGAICYAGTVTLFVVATKMTTAANAILLQYTAPIYVALLGRLVLQERPTNVDWLTMLLMSIGMVLFFLDKVTATGLIGNIVGALSGVCFAGFILATRKQAQASPIQSVIYGNLITAVITLPFILHVQFSTSSLTGLILLGVFQLALPYIFYSVAIKRITAVESSLILVIEPLLNPVWVFFYSGETPGPNALVGGSLVIAALLLRNILKARLATAQ